MSDSKAGQGRSPELVRGDISGLPKRGLHEETCKKFGYATGTYRGQPCQIAPYYDATGRVVAQHIRLPSKQFAWVGDRSTKLTFFGQHVWGSGGKSVVITEGELDALSVAQAFNCKWPVVSLPDGAQSAKKAIKEAYEWLNTFDKVVLCFDQDEPGIAAMQECAELLPVGKAYVMHLPRKDANEVLTTDGTEPIVRAYWDANEWRPDGIIKGTEFTLELMKSQVTSGYSLPWPLLSSKLGGIYEGALTLLTAGSGIGKSTAAKEIAYHLSQVHGLTVGNIFLEESTVKTAQSYVAIHNNVPLKKLREDPSILSDEQWSTALNKVVHSMYFYDHYGSLDSGRLLAKMRYMRQVLGCNFIILDHLSIVISGQESSSEGERRDIDRLMTALRSLIEETGVGVLAIVHLSQPIGKPHEEGGRVTLSQLRGSGSLKQLSDCVWCIERDQQDPDNRNKSMLRVLKDREGGEVGEADTLIYDERGRLVSIGTFTDCDGNDIC
jgi:twinkle protein